MRYAKIRKMDVSNGEGIRVSLFVQGCEFHCEGCFNSETWSFEGGKAWTDKVREAVLELASRPNVRGLSILGGEPLHPANLEDVTELAKCFKERFPTKDIWLWSGFIYEQYIQYLPVTDYIDYIVDGQFKLEERDMSLKFRGSANQRVINVKETKIQNKIVMYE